MCSPDGGLGGGFGRPLSFAIMFFDMPEPKSFEFVSYKIDPKKDRVYFNYKINFKNQKPLTFTEIISLPQPIPAGITLQSLKNILESLHLALGVSYYKLYCPPQIKTQYKLSVEQVKFWNTLYTKGLGEFFYKNKIDPRGLIRFPQSKKEKPAICFMERQDRALVGIGGGKDSVVVAELLKESGADFSAFLVETQRESKVSRDVIGLMGADSIVIKRFLDEKLFQQHPGSYNGHVPVSAIVAFLGQLAAMIYDYSYIVVGNEQSSSFGNVSYCGEEINHQWSKSAEFEELFQRYVKKYICGGVIYFSILRPFFEIRVAEMFAKHKKYFPQFSSCNKNFTVNKERPVSLWCGECPKCVFVFVMLSPFLKKEELLGIFKKNLYGDIALLSLFEEVLGFKNIKPFDCVGTFEESRAAFTMASKDFDNEPIVKALGKKAKVPGSVVKKVFSTSMANVMPARFKFAGIKNVVILGYGKEGKVTESYIKKFYPNVKIIIADKSLNKNYLNQQEGADLVVKTPGIPKELVTRPYTTATNIFFSSVKNKIIGVTGTKGKSTTTSLIAAILKEAGKNVELMGNIGNPMLNELLLPVDPNKIFVAELSSYQLDDLRQSPNIAVILNLFPEHMTYHNGAANYYNAKRSITNFQSGSDFFVYNDSDPKLKKWARESFAKVVPVSRVSVKKYKTSLLGKHNQSNLRAAVAVAKLFKIPDSVMEKAIEKFKSLPHRLDHVGEFRGITFYDDAISTTPESTIMAIESLPKIGTIFLGGEDRGYDFIKLEKVIRKYKIKNVVLFPDTGKRIFKSQKGFNVLETRNMEEAVKFAYKNTPEGEICLLSMASPSYSLWKNFEEKGDLFKQFVLELAGD